jgi:hypothetical protein
LIEMSRLRILAAMLGCLAAIAAGLPAIAAVSAPAPHSDLSISAGSMPCEHCQDCDGAACPKVVDCTAPCAVSLPTLGVASVELRWLEPGQPVGLALATSLHGEHPPPDPFPPRA